MVCSWIPSEKGEELHAKGITLTPTGIAIKTDMQAPTKGKSRTQDVHYSTKLKVISLKEEIVESQQRCVEFVTNNTVNLD